MPLNQSQKTIWEKARALGSGGLAVRLDDATCTYLIGRIVFDLGLQESFPEFGKSVPDFFTQDDLSSLRIPGHDPRSLFERLISSSSDGDMYFACLSTLHKSRIKYEAILEHQPIPTLEQVGPRGLLQYGKFAPEGLVGFLLWRKWFFDIDNRAGQETGYLFEPIIANAVGGVPISATRSPVKRHKDQRKGRQVDCLIGDKAYEIKIRMTIAASGQGRWKEELDYPIDCKESGFVPILVVLDSTSNPKLKELEKAFINQGGEAYIGEAAWEHLDQLAGATMATFLERYVRTPLRHLLSENLMAFPDLEAKILDGLMTITVGGHALSIRRSSDLETSLESERDQPTSSDQDLGL